MPRRARYLIPTQLPRRGELMAACAAALLIAHLVFAQLTLVLAVVFVGVSRISRWRLWWLAVPAAAGIVWTLAIGPANAARGFGAGPAHILGYLSAHGLIHLHGAFADASEWLPRQVPLALVAAAAEAAAVGWLDWLHTDAWALAPTRPGLLAAARGATAARAIRSGAVVARDGCHLGVDPATGARVTLRWAEATAGVLLTGAAARDVTAASFQFAHAALRLRKPVIVLDLSGDPAMGGDLTRACAATGTPLRTFGTGETAAGCYEPFREGTAAERTELLLALLGGASGADIAEAALRGAFELMAEVPSGPRAAVLDDVLHLLNPLAMQARFGLVCAASPLAAQIAERVRVAVRQAQSAPEAVASLALALAAVRNSPAGRWLRPGEADHPAIDLRRVIRERSAALFQVDSPPVARLVCADLLALSEDLRRISADGDGVIVLCGCEKLPEDVLARLVHSGARARLAIVAATTSARAAAELAGSFGTLVMHRIVDADARHGQDGDADGAQGAAASLAARTGTRLLPLGASATLPPVIAPGPTAPASAPHPAGITPSGLSQAEYQLVSVPAVPVRTLLTLGAGHFVLAVRSPRPRLVELARTVPSRLPRGPHPARVPGSEP